ncbi:hypothetical protein [Mycobacteroides abscessus]|uniref:hypothetical protein n=1 Tax=Mycobacteroides abscessus TaxID=36809 RepID=UPI0011BE9F6A|nr:hypothetical protein [Mycobacteroides abscessus]
MKAEWMEPGVLVGTVGVAVAVMGVAVSTLIAWRLHKASSRVASESNRVVENIRDLTVGIEKLVHLGRLDEIYKSLQTIRDHDLLRRYITEGRKLVPEGTERVVMERFYFANPATPLITEEALIEDGIPPGLHKDVVQAAVASLPKRYSVPHDYLEAGVLATDLSKLIRLAYRIELAGSAIVSSAPSVLEQAFSFMRTLMLEGWEISNSIGRLVDPWDPDIAKRFIFMIEDHQIPQTIFARVLTDVSWHIHDHVLPHAPNGVSIDDKNHTLLHAYASLLHRGFLEKIGSWPRTERAGASVFQCIGSTAYVIGLLAHEGPIRGNVHSHVTRNLIVDLTEALKSFEALPESYVTEGMSQLSMGIRRITKKHRETQVIEPLVEAANILLSRSHLREARTDEDPGAPA